MRDTLKFISIKKARENNLKGIDLVLPKNNLIIFTGVSGSGKSSLAFSTIYEEGRRRYVESLSSYARQFLGNTKKPLVDSIEGLIPAISIEQKTTHNNPRSTVGTVTEIYDYLRLLFARIGKSFCPKHNVEISSQKIQDVIEAIYKHPSGTKIMILSPVVKNEKGTHAKLLETLKHEGFIRVQINKKIYNLDEEITLSKNKRHSIEIVVDRIVIAPEEKSRLTEAIELAFEYGKGEIIVQFNKADQQLFSRNLACPYCDFNMPKIEPRIFSFNSPSGMCNDCKGLGIKLRVDTNKLVPNKELSINKGAIEYFKNLVNSENLEWQQFKCLCKFYKIDLDKPLKDFSPAEWDIILNGSTDYIDYTLYSSSGNRYDKYEIIEGIAKKIERKHLSSTSEMVRTWYRKKFMSDILCSSCNGKRLNAKSLSVKIAQKNIYELTKFSVTKLLNWIVDLKLSPKDAEISQLIINEIYNRLLFLNNVGLSYLSLDRKAETLSGGESQRIRLATQIGSNLTGVLYVLDEPSIGLHQKDNRRLISTLKKMVDVGNTLIVVEHDEETIKSGDFIVDLGPRAGDKGGKIVVSGTLDKIINCSKSITGDYLAKRKKIPVPRKRRLGNGKFIEVMKAEENNLKKISVKFPLGKLIAVTGVSGSGKSSLINEVLTKGIKQKLTNPFLVAGKHEKILGVHNINKVVRISQSPIGRTPRSNPATYTSVFDNIRDVYANVPLSKARGYKKGRFSFNVDGGRCENCKGDGVIRVSMHFMPDVYVKCDYCNGKKYNLETLDVKFKSKNIYDILEMRVSEAFNFFKNHPQIKMKLQALIDVGLGYIKLGQNAVTLSGGEAQRVKLATFLQKKPSGRTLYVLDEPTTGLHQHDVKKLISVLSRLVDGGDTVIIIEHNLDVIKTADYIIDLGPGGGDEGGRIVATGTPEQLAKNGNSHTGHYLKRMLNEK